MLDKAKKLGVCMLIPFLHNQTGGMERQVWQMSQLLQAKGVQVFFITCVRFWEIFTKKLKLKDSVNGIIIYRIPGIFPPFGNKIFPLEFLIGANFLINKIKNQIDLFHAHQLFSSGLVVAFLKKKIQKPVIVKIASGGPDGDVADILKFPFSQYKIKKIQALDHFVAINPKILDELDKLKLARNKSVEVPNGVDCETFQPRLNQKLEMRKKLNLPNKKIVCFIGRIIEVKQFHYLVDIWPELLKAQPDTQLIVLGKPDFTSDYSSKIRLKIAKIGLSANIAFLGTFPNPQDYLSASDAFVLPSRSEGLSNALLEAASTGLPIVASDIPGNRMVIEHQKNGLLFNPTDPQKLLSCLRELLTNPTLAEELGTKARITILEKYSLDSITQKYLELYSKLIRNSSNLTSSDKPGVSDQLPLPN